MNLRDLKYLLAVSEYKNFTKAADYCATTQPTLSNQIRKLENFLDVEIFERGTHFVRVTPIGQKIIDAAKRVVENSNLIVQIARTSSHNEQSRLVFGSFPSLGNYIPLQYVFKLKQQSFEHIKIQHIEEDVDVLIDLLTKQEVDFALLPFPVLHADLDGLKLFDDPLYVAVPLSHAYAAFHTIKLNDLSDEPILFLVEDQSYYRRILNQFDVTFSRHHQEQDDDFRAVNFEALRMMVKHGLGLAIIPGSAINKDDLDVRYIPFESQEISRSIGMYWHKHHANSALMGEIYSLLKSELALSPNLK